MSVTDCTVVVVPRETFRQSLTALSRLLDRTDPSVRIVYVDGGSPPAIRRGLEELARRRDVHLVRTEHFLSPNEARNLGFTYVQTPYVVFVDNDVIVDAGWLERLVACAEDTGAAIVGPLYGFAHGDSGRVTVHMAGGVNRIELEGGRRHHLEDHLGWGEDMAEAQATRRRQETEGVEFHCMLVRSDLLRRLGPLDEALLSINEHCDLCLAAREAGESVWIEPAAVASYVVPERLHPSDLPYFLMRWSDGWNRASLDRFRDKWSLDPDDPSLERMMDFGANHRLYAYRPLRPPLGRVVRRRGRVPRPLYDRVGHRVLKAIGERRRRHASTPRVVHRATWTPRDDEGVAGRGSAPREPRPDTAVP